MNEPRNFASGHRQSLQRTRTASGQRRDLLPLHPPLDPPREPETLQRSRSCRGSQQQAPRVKASRPPRPAREEKHREIEAEGQKTTAALSLHRSTLQVAAAAQRGRGTTRKAQETSLLRELFQAARPMCNQRPRALRLLEITRAVRKEAGETGKGAADGARLREMPAKETEHLGNRPAVRALRAQLQRAPTARNVSDAHEFV